MATHRLRVEAENQKNVEEAERLDREATEDALRQMAELDAQLQVSDNKPHLWCLLL